MEQKPEGELLDHVYEVELAKLREKFQSQKASISVDGWSTPQNDPVVGVAMTCNGCVTATSTTFSSSSPPSYTALFATVDTSGIPHTSESLMDIVEEQVAEAESLFGVEVVTVATDNQTSLSVVLETEHTGSPAPILRLVKKLSERCLQSTPATLLACES